MNQSYLAQFDLPATVRSDDIVNVIKDARRGNGNGSSDAFFGGLEDKFHRAAQAVFVLHQPTSNGKAHCSMTIVATGVHQPRVLGAESFTIGSVIRIVRFLYRVAVYVKAQSGHRSCATCI